MTERVLLTHLHSDHFTDLGDVITTQWITTFEPTPLPLYGPGRTQEVVDGVLASLGPDIEYRLDGKYDRFQSDVGIDDDFINSVRNEVTPGTSALFLMTSDVVTDKVKGAFEGSHAELLHTNLSNEQEAKLREVFSG